MDDAGLDLSPVPSERRTASVLDVLLVFAGANIVTTTLVTGGSIASAFSWPRTMAVVAVGTITGVAILGLLARLGPRFGLPTMVLLRQPFGHRGAAAISFLLLVTNFAWIALNNVIAARALVDIGGRTIAGGVQPDRLKAAEATIPLGRGGTAEEAAGAVYMFCIPESNYVSGQVLVCGGGRP